MSSQLSALTFAVSDIEPQLLLKRITPQEARLKLFSLVASKDVIVSEIRGPLSGSVKKSMCAFEAAVQEISRNIDIIESSRLTKSFRVSDSRNASFPPVASSSSQPDIAPFRVDPDSGIGVSDASLAQRSFSAANYGSCTPSMQPKPLVSKRAVPTSTTTKTAACAPPYQPGTSFLTGLDGPSRVSMGEEQPFHLSFFDCIFGIKAIRGKICEANDYLEDPNKGIDELVKNYELIRELKSDLNLLSDLKNRGKPLGDCPFFDYELDEIKKILKLVDEHNSWLACKSRCECCCGPVIVLLCCPCVVTWLCLEWLYETDTTGYSGSYPQPRWNSAQPIRPFQPSTTSHYKPSSSHYQAPAYRAPPARPISFTYIVPKFNPIHGGSYHLGRTTVYRK